MSHSHNGDADIVVDQHGHEHQRPVLEWGGLVIDMPVLRLFAAFWVSIVVAGGCIGIILGPTNEATTEAAIAILASLITGWISFMARY